MFVIAIIRWVSLLFKNKLSKYKYINKPKHTIQLCDDMLEVLYTKLPFHNKCILSQTSIMFYKIFIQNIIAITKIQKYFRKYRVQWQYWEKMEDVQESINKKKYLIRLYMALYYDEDLLEYPMLLVQKCGRADLKVWLNKHQIKTRRHARNFLNLNEVRQIDITSAGW